MNINNKCPKCGSEIYDYILDSCPPLILQRCTNCGWAIRSDYNQCKTCPNHTQNGGSGVCACTLGMPKIN